MLSRRALIRGVAGLAWLAVTLIVPATDAQPQRPMLPEMRQRMQEMQRERQGQPPPQVDSQPLYEASAFSSALARHRGRFAHLGGGGALNPMIHRYADPLRVTDASSGRSRPRRSASSTVAPPASARCRRPLASRRRRTPRAVMPIAS